MQMAATLLTSKDSSCRGKGRGLLRYGTGNAATDENRQPLRGTSRQVDWVSSHWSSTDELLESSSTCASSIVQSQRLASMETQNHCKKNESRRSNAHIDTDPSVVTKSSILNGKLNENNSCSTLLFMKQPFAEPAGCFVTKTSVSSASTVPSRPCQDASSETKFSPHSLNNSLRFPVHKTLSVPDVETTSLKTDYADTDVLLASTPSKATVSISNPSSALESSVSLGTTDVSLGLKYNALVAPIKPTNCFSESLDEFDKKVDAADLARSFVLPQNQLSEWVNNPLLTGVMSPVMLLDVNQNVVPRTNVSVPSPIIPITIAHSYLAQNVPPPALISQILSFPNINHVVGQQLPQSYPPAPHYVTYQTPPASVLPLHKIHSQGSIPCQLNNVDMSLKHAEYGRILVEQQKTLSTDKLQSVNISNNANADLSLSFKDKAAKESIDKLFRSCNLQHKRTQSVINSHSTGVSPLRPLAKVFMPKAYLDESMHVTSGCGRNSTSAMKKFSVLLASLQNYNQYDEDIDQLKLQLLKILTEVDSTELLRWAVKELYSKSVLDERFSYIGSRICSFLAFNLTRDIGSFWSLLLERCCLDFESHNEMASTPVKRSYLCRFTLFLAELMLAHKTTSGQVCILFPKYLTSILTTLMSTGDVECFTCVVRTLKLSGIVLDETEYRSVVDKIVHQLRLAIVDSTFTKSIRMLMLSVLEQRASGWSDQQPQQSVAEEPHSDLDTLGNLSELGYMDENGLMHYDEIGDMSSSLCDTSRTFEEDNLDWYPPESSLDSNSFNFEQEYFDAQTGEDLDDDSIDDMDPEIAMAFEDFLAQTAAK